MSIVKVCDERTSTMKSERIAEPTESLERTVTIISKQSTVTESKLEMNQEMKQIVSRTESNNISRKSKFNKSSYLQKRHLREKRRPTGFAAVDRPENIDDEDLEVTTTASCLNSSSSLAKDIARFTQLFTATASHQSS